jgi:periplasmic divalent cation tolerance protein
MPVRLLLSSAPDAETARRIADALVADGLAACVSLLPGVASVYRWQGRLEHASETLLLVKSAASVAAIAARLRELHPYELPELLAVEAGSGLPAYLDWVIANSAGAAAGEA